jgi:hypothetical protein
VPPRSRKDAGAFSLPDALTQIARGGWIIVLCLAVSALSAPTASIPVSGRSPAIGNASTDLAAVARAAGLYDLSRTPRAVHEWKSDRQKHRPLRHGDGTALASTRLEIEAQPTGPENREYPVAMAFRPFSAFAARAPPSGSLSPLNGSLT